MAEKCLGLRQFQTKFVIGQALSKKSLLMRNSCIRISKGSEKKIVIWEKNQLLEDRISFLEFDIDDLEKYGRRQNL